MHVEIDEKEFGALSINKLKISGKRSNQISKIR
jgi:hypothetical protein